MQPGTSFLDSQRNWETFYRKKFNKRNLLYEYNSYRKNVLQDTLDQILKVWKPGKKDTYLEIGCGPCFLGLELAKRTNTKIIGIDFSPTAIKAAEYLFKKEGIKDAQFILGDIANMPLSKNSVDFIFGGGVIEHSKNVQKVINEVYRVLKKGGIAYNTVPLLNLASLTYRQVWGSIPYIPFIKNFFEFIHLNLLGGKHMRFGYELSFLPSTLYKMHIKAGFTKIKIDKFRANLVFEYLPFLLLRKIAAFISARSLLFWPVIYISAKK